MKARGIDSLKDCISTSPLLDLPTLVGQLMYALSGKSIRPYPAGFLLAISAMIMASRFVSRIVEGRQHS